MISYCCWGIRYDSRICMICFLTVLYIGISQLILISKFSSFPATEPIEKAIALVSRRDGRFSMRFSFILSFF